MGLLLLTICINALIGVVFKYFNKFNVNILPAIVINYYVCVLTSMLITQSWTVNLDTPNKAYFIPSLLLGITFILVFNIVARTVGDFGIVVATLFQKMSLIAPTIVAILIFGESLGAIKLIGILLAIGSIFFITGFFERKESILEKTAKKSWLLPILVLLGSCVIDTGLYLVETMGIASNGDIGFVATLFFSAAVSGSLLLVFKKINNSLIINKKDVLAGIALGVPNFFSIYLILLLLADGWDGSQVFPINNVGILSVSAIIGFFLFKEKATYSKVGGVVLSIIAIIMIAYA